MLLPRERRTIGLGALFTGLILVGMLFLVPGLEPRYGRPLTAIMMSAPCAVIFLACIMPRSRPVTVRLIGANICALTGFGLFWQITRTRFVTYHHLYELIESMFLLLFVGVPCGMMVLTRKYPRWGKLGKVFSSERPATSDWRATTIRK